MLNDVRQPLAPNAVRALAAAMADPTVGCATGNLVVAGEAGSGIYWRYENWIRQQDRVPGRSRINRFPKTFPVSEQQAVKLLEDAIDDLVKNYGTSFIPWGNINRLQRIHRA